MSKDYSNTRRVQWIRSSIADSLRVPEGQVAVLSLK